MKPVTPLLTSSLAFHHFFVYGVQGKKSVLEGVILSLETDLPQNSNTILTQKTLFPLGSTALLL